MADTKPSRLTPREISNVTVLREASLKTFRDADIALGDALNMTGIPSSIPDAKMRTTRSAIHAARTALKETIAQISADHNAMIDAEMKKWEV